MSDKKHVEHDVVLGQNVWRKDNGDGTYSSQIGGAEPLYDEPESYEDAISSPEEYGARDLKDLPIPEPQDMNIGTVSPKVEMVEHADDEPVLFKHLNENLRAIIQIVKPQLDVLPYHACVLSLVMERLGISEEEVQAHREKLYKQLLTRQAQQFNPNPNKAN